MKKTYIAPGLLDFRMVLLAGDAWVTLEFKGGRSSGYGEYSATFSTDDPSLQYLIAQSPEFRNGRILLLDTNGYGGHDPKGYGG